MMWPDREVVAPGKDVAVIQVVRTRLLRRGAGRAPDDPVRIIEQYWSLDGALLAEVDPWGGGAASDAENGGGAA